MRRKDKEITDRAEIEEILTRAQVCRVAFSKDNIPYIVPLCFGYRDGRLFFHSALEGTKLDMITHNSAVCFEVETDLDLVAGPRPCAWTMHFRSVIGFGTASMVEDVEGKQAALECITSHYCGETSSFEGVDLSSVSVFVVDIERMTGKKSPR